MPIMRDAVHICIVGHLVSCSSCPTRGKRKNDTSITAVLSNESIDCCCNASDIFDIWICTKDAVHLQKTNAPAGVHCDQAVVVLLSPRFA